MIPNHHTGAHTVYWGLQPLSQQLATAAAAAADSQTQAAFRFGADDGNEASHGWIADQNVDISQAANIAAILRIQVDNIGDFPAQQMTLQYKLSTQPESEYRDVPVAS